ncbi:MAG: (2Fe-2S)-binding protein [Candidatus Hodarchaeales archaeon]|jgi:aerobic-type carbon monoxide dehydrogenase small subunit (CoxS/CutS family)
MNQILNVTINGIKKNIEIRPKEFLIDVLRREGYKGVKRGCDEGTCGTCTILFNGKAVKSCIMLAAQTQNGKITTIEGIGTRDNPHPIQQAFVDAGVVQCGFCIPGMLLSAKDLLDHNLKPTKEEVKMALDGNLCRCTGYRGQIDAVLNAAAVMRGEK